MVAHNCTWLHMGEGKPWGLAWVSWLSAGGWKAVSMVTMVLALPLILLLRAIASFQTVFPWWWCPALTIPQMALTGAWIHCLPPRAVCVYTRVAWRPPEIEREWGAASTSRNDNLLLIDSAQDAVYFSEIFSFSNCMNEYFADTWWSLKWQRQPMLSR